MFPSWLNTRQRRTAFLVSIGLTLCACTGESTTAPQLTELPPVEEADASFTLAPANPQSGETFSASFGQTNSRGGYFELSQWNGEAWNEPVFLLESGVNGQPPTATRVSDDSAVLDYGREGPGPDNLIMPSRIDDGHWRLCTANALDHVCTQIIVGLSKDQS